MMPYLQGYQGSVFCRDEEAKERSRRIAGISMTICQQTGRQ
ncbi:MAG: hypothetical protein ACTS7E_01565 [Arsenophonus sp. NC-CH8-MAG3]